MNSGGFDIEGGKHDEFLDLDEKTGSVVDTKPTERRSEIMVRNNASDFRICI